MYGNTYLKNVKMNVTEEGFKAHEVAKKAINDLANATGRGWHLTTDNAFRHARVKSFMEGGLVAALGMLAGIGVHIVRKKRLEDKRLEENQRLEEEVGV